jgi:hypothetical protein
MSSFASKKALPQGAVPAIAEPIVRGVVLVKDLERGGAGIAGFVKGWERLIHGHSNGSVSAMFTHFAWLLQTQSGQTYILERGTDGVTLSPEEDEQEDADFVATIEWEPEREGYVDGAVLNHFVAEQRTLTYDLATKNCKHLVYDFYTQCLKPGCDENFGDFCFRAEKVYRGA